MDALENHRFDWLASRRVRPGRLFYGLPDQALWSMRAARRAGAKTMLHAVNTHIENFAAELNREARLQGAGTPGGKISWNW